MYYKYITYISHIHHTYITHILHIYHTYITHILHIHQTYITQITLAYKYTFVPFNVFLTRPVKKD